MEYCSVRALAQPPFAIALFRCQSRTAEPKRKKMEGHDLPRHEALQQDEATSAAHFRPAVLVPGVDVSHFHCAQVKREREREIEGERESGFLKTHRWAVLVPTSTLWGQVLRSDWLVTGDLVFSMQNVCFPAIDGKSQDLSSRHQASKPPGGRAYARFEAMDLGFL